MVHRRGGRRSKFGLGRNGGIRRLRSLRVSSTLRERDREIKRARFGDPREREDTEIDSLRSRRNESETLGNRDALGRIPLGGRGSHLAMCRGIVRVHIPRTPLDASRVICFNEEEYHFK